MKPPGSPLVWLALANLVLALVVVYLYAANRAVLARQQSDLEKICSTNDTLDLALIHPLLDETKIALRELPPGPQRDRIRRYRDNLYVAHIALSETRSCEAVR